MNEKVALWRGRPVAECSREELIACIEWLHRALENERRFQTLNEEVLSMLHDKAAR